MTQETALALMRSGQMTEARYMELCKERGWNPKWGLLPKDTTSEERKSAPVAQMEKQS